ncbi:MAG: AMP-binding protein [Xanthobacteraceae bacterium]|nr:AMP-binding protein [Xanthobacteraceae bacterium]PWB66415.1 MAG: long-chain fatty acid--CoA ligase [Bradyrhizobiaceae bacterium]
MEAQEAVALNPAGTDTVPKMFWHGVTTRADEVILRQKELGVWQSVTWREFGEIAREVGLGLVALGFEPGETAAILSNTNREWLYADMGVLGAGGVSYGIYPTDAPGQVEYVCTDSRTVYVFVEDDEQLDKVLEVRGRLPLLRRIVVFDMDGLRDFDDPQVISLDALRALGRELHAREPGLWERRLVLRKPGDLAMLIYTSGTTGRPKGAMLSHGNVIAAISLYRGIFGQKGGDERICFLPLCHVAERVVGAYTSLLTGTKLNFVENPETVPENVREIAPTVYGAVPRVWEKFYSFVQIRLKEATRLQQLAYAAAIGIGSRVAARRERGRPVPAWLRIAHRIARFLVLDNIRRMIGAHRARLLITGAAPISPDLLRWYMALGLEVMEVWGQTESGGISTANPVGRAKPGSIGLPLPHTEVKLSPDNELMVKSPSVFMGYLNMPDKTAEALRDGWLHTGDVGRMDEDGYFYITDRMKDIIITAGGKNVTPSEIENQLKFSPYITDAVVIGDRRPFLTALVMIDHENVEKFAQDHAIPFSNYTSLCRRPEIQELIQGEIDKVNKLFARVEQVRKFRLIEQKLTAEDEELTPTMKLKRQLVNEKYRELIEGMYAKEAA